MSNITNWGVYGGGSWGTALACHVARAIYQKGGRSENLVDLYVRDAGIAEEINNQRTNRKYLKKASIPFGVHATNDVSLLIEKEAIIIAVPSNAIEETIEILKNAGLKPSTVLVLTSKGIIDGSPPKLQSEVINHMLPENPMAFLVGPSFASEVALGLPTHVTIASLSNAVALNIARSLETKEFKPSITDDIIIVQIAGAMKNIVAIKSGLLGAEIGETHDNAKAALMLEAIQEILAISKAMRNQTNPSAILQPAVLGDLILTCYSRQSRNLKFGIHVGDFLHGMGLNTETDHSELTEGVRATHIVNKLMKHYGVELPIVTSVITTLNLYEQQKKMSLGIL